VPQPVTAQLFEPGGPWNYRLSTWRSILSAFAPKLGLEGLPQSGRIVKRPVRETRGVTPHRAEE
jgi:hypothetical protein